MKWLVFIIFLATSASATTPTLAPHTYEQLMRAQKNTEGEGAVFILEQLAAEPSLKPYDRAMTLQQLAFAHAQKLDYDKAVELLERTIALHALPPPQQQQVWLNLARIYIAGTHYSKARELLKQQKQTAEVFALLAQTYAPLGEWRPAIFYAERAVQGTRPRKDWLQLLEALYIEQKFYRKALAVAERGALLYPQEKIFWQQLVGLYGQLGEEKKSFATLRTMFHLNLLSHSSEWTQLAQSYMAEGAPAVAARVLEKGFSENAIEKNEKNYTLLGNAWMLAREWSKAIPPLEGATAAAVAAAAAGAARPPAVAAAAAGKAWFKLGKCYMGAEQWHKAEAAFARALAAPAAPAPPAAFTKKGETWLLLGVARAKQEKKELAIAALGKAVEFDHTSSQAKAWLDNLRQKR